ncbi:trigger factor [Oceanicella actignis]|uniref:Trigger factor n=1 Tax=Oceanicella actignis TaxID=1189325 RepID=A0A1M7RTT6_9RHOB|nr:trigger factor [Oceanicella actignis]TYO89437.1 trigger factor [Oceanicella actignis]SET03748.1 trigger factor [Oceanicella actignis]SHN49705.1 trigger factor [Oceanicella actignis]
MQDTETQSNGLKREHAMTVPAADLAAKMNEKLEAARETVQLKGFRKGKTPLPLLKKMFGKSLMGEVVQEAVDAAVRAHFEKTGDRPAIQPDIRITNENFDEGDDLNLSLTYEVLPEIPETDFSVIKLERLVVEVEDSAVDEALANLAENVKDFAPREEGEAAQNGDQVVIDFVGKLDGEPFEGGAAEDYPLVLGSGAFIPGFEEQIVGAKAGDEIEVKVAFPENYGAENLAGKDAVFEVKVKEVRAPQAAAIDDELAKKFGVEDLETLKSQLRERLGEEFKGAARALLKRKLLDALDEMVKFDLPPTLVEQEAQQIAHQLWHEEHPEVQGHDHPEIEVTDEHRKLAERRVRLGLLLAELGRRNEIEVTEQELNQAIFNQARQYPGQEKAFFDFVRQNPQALQQIRAPLFEDKVVDYVLELTQIEDKTVTKDELQKALEALEQD